MANIPPDLPPLISDSDTSDSGESAEMEDETEAGLCWYPEPSLVQEIFDSPEVPLVLAAFRRRHISLPFSPLEDQQATPEFKQELWNILSGTQEPAEEFVKQLVESQGRKAAICGKIWGKNDLAYRCLDCGTGPCSAICAECFINGNHQSHNYVMYHSSAGGCCDCGDADAWLPSGNCCFHSDSDCRLLQALPPSVSARLYTVVSSVLWIHCASISFGNHPFVADVIEWLLSVAESCDILRELVGDVFIQRLPPGDPDSPEMARASRSIEALMSHQILQVSVPIPVSFFTLRHHNSYPVLPNISTPAFLLSLEAHAGRHSLFMSFINTHLFCLEISNKLLLTIVLLPAVKDVFGEAFICRYHTLIQIIVQQPPRHVRPNEGDFCTDLQDQMIDLSVQLLSNARIVQHLITQCSYFTILFSSYLEALSRAVVPNDALSAFVLPSVVCVLNSASMPPEPPPQPTHDGSPQPVIVRAKSVNLRTADAINMMQRIAELQCGCHVEVPASYLSVRRSGDPDKAFFIPLNVSAQAAAFSADGSGRRIMNLQLSSYIRDIKDRTAHLQRNFGGMSRFPHTGGFPIPGTLQVDHLVTDTGPDKKRLHVVTSDLSNIFFHHGAVAVFLEDAASFDMFLNVAKLIQFADGQLMFVHRHIESVTEDKWIRGLNMEREHFSSILANFTSALVPRNVFVPMASDRGQLQAPSSLLPEKQLSILYSCLRRTVIFLLKHLTAAIEKDATFSFPMWLKHSNQLLEHYDSNQFVTCCIFHPISFHLPIHRTLSYFLALLVVHKQRLAADSPIRELLNPSCAALALQHPLSLLTAVCQARLNMWIRNGNMMTFRSWFYMHHFVRDQFVNLDGFLLQAACACIDPDALWTRVLASFGFSFSGRVQALQSSALWFFTEQSETAPALFESFLMLMLSLLTGSWSPAFVVGFSDSECDISRIKTEICSLLAIKDKTYSELQSSLPRTVSSHPSFDTVLESLTTFTPPSSRTLKEGSYRLLPSVFEHHFSAVRVYFSAYRLADVDAAILNWSSQFNSSSMKANDGDLHPRSVRFVCAIDDPIICDYYPLIFCDKFWQVLRCLCFSVCSSFDQTHHTNMLHLPAAFAQAAVDAALRSGRELEVFHKMNEPVATFVWELSPDEDRELVTGGSTPVLTSICDSLHAIKDAADSDPNLACLVIAYNYTLHSIQKLIAESSESSGSFVRSRECPPSISRKKSTAMAARQSALARIRLLQQHFSSLIDDNAMASPGPKCQPSDEAPHHSPAAAAAEFNSLELQEAQSPTPTQRNASGFTVAAAATVTQASSQPSSSPEGDIFCADDLGACCICTSEDDYNDPLGLLVSISLDPMSGSFDTFLSALSPSDPLLAAVTSSESALIRSCGHAAHVSCMKTWLDMHQGPHSKFFDGFPCPLCRSWRNAVLPLAPRSHDAVVDDVLSSFPIRLRERERQSPSNDRVARAVAAFESTAFDAENQLFEEARQYFLQSCMAVVGLSNRVDAEPDDSSIDLFGLLSVRLLHWHARYFRTCLPYAESHRANSLVMCLLRRLNAYQISSLLSPAGNGDGDALGSPTEWDNSGLLFRMTDADFICLRSILVAATIISDQPDLAPAQTPLQAHHTLHFSAPTGMDASSSHSNPSSPVAARYEEVTKKTLIASFCHLSTVEGHPSSTSMNGRHLLLCNSSIVATMAATILPSNSHAKCLTAALLLLHAVAGSCPHLFKPPAMSQPLGMIDLATRAIFAIISSGSCDAIVACCAPLTQALHDDQKPLVCNLIAHTMQFVCDIFLIKMSDFAGLAAECSERLHRCLDIWAGLLSHAVLDDSPCSIARFHAHSGFSPLPDFIPLPATFQELMWEHRRSNCCICSESSLKKKELCVCLFCGAVICCNTSTELHFPDMPSVNPCFFMHLSNCCGPPMLGVAVCIGDTNVHLLRSQGPAFSWGSLYVDKHGRADPNLRSGIQGLTLSAQRLHLLRSLLLQRSLPDGASQHL